MDWLRIGAFGLLILYHVGMVFVPWDHHVKTEAPANWVAIPMLASNAWRLALLFVVSGFATANLFAKDRTVGPFLLRRSGRLLWPLLFGMAVIVPPQPWVELMVKHGYAGDYWTFWTRDYFRFGALDGIVLPTWNHLWFIAYLWVYTVLLGLALLLPQGLRDRLGLLADRAFAGPFVLVLPILLLCLRRWMHWPGAPETHDLLNDWQTHEVYFASFLFGYLLAGSQRIWAAVRRWWKVAAGLAVLSYGVVATVEAMWPGSAVPPSEIIILFRVARDMQGWSAIVALIGFADRYWNRDHRWRATLNEAVFPLYIVHQTIIVVAAWLLIGRGSHPGLQFTLLVAITAAGCWAFYLAGRRLWPLRPFIGLRGWQALDRRTAVAGSRPAA